MQYVVSNSEALSLQTCERQHYYGYTLRIQPKTMPKPLVRGLVGHEALEEYYKNDFNIKAALNVVDKYMIVGAKILGKYDLEDLAKLRSYIKQYDIFYAEDKNIVEIEEVEQMDSLQLSDGEDEIHFVKRPDLIAKYKSGRYAGQRHMWDHKFYADFMSEKFKKIYMQGPKYQAVAACNNRPVDIFVLNQIRTRDSCPGPRFYRDPLDFSIKRLQRAINEQYLISKKVAERQKLSIEEQGETAVRTANDIVCRSCWFNELCGFELADNSPDQVKLFLHLAYENSPYKSNYEQELQGRLIPNV